MSEKIELGRAGEQAAANYLAENNYTIIERNWHFGRYEIDIICKNNNVLAFVEVKSHHENECFDIRLMVNNEKQRKIKAGANAYVKYTRSLCDVRFDIIVDVKAP